MASQAQRIEKARAEDFITEAERIKSILPIATAVAQGLLAHEGFSKKPNRNELDSFSCRVASLTEAVTNAAVRASHFEFSYERKTTVLSLAEMGVPDVADLINGKDFQVIAQRDHWLIREDEHRNQSAQTNQGTTDSVEHGVGII